MSDKYSADWLREKVRETHSTHLDLRECSICGTPLSYEFQQDGDGVVFHSSCDCTTYYTPPRPSSYEEIANTLAMQSNDEIRDRIVSRLNGIAGAERTEDKDG